MILARVVGNIVATQKRVAGHYFQDGTVEFACPPLKALLHIMAKGEYEGKDLNHPEIRALFTREALLGSDWYRERLARKQAVDRSLWERHVKYLKEMLKAGQDSQEDYHLTIADRLQNARKQLERVSAPAYLEELQGTIGAQPV